MNIESWLNEKSLLRNGGGFDYDEKERGFIYHQTNLYIEDLPEVMNKK